jgi:hypothetical protein
MKCEIYEEGKKDETVYIKMEDGGERIMFKAVDERGHHMTTICSIGKFNGTLYLHRDVNSSLGLALDEDGCIMIEKT